MSDQLVIAWATEMDASQLGARLEAYSETKPAIEAFMKLKRNLPAEVKEIITNAVKDQAYVRIIGSWLQAESCYDAYCTQASHFTAQELHHKANVNCDWNADPIDFSCLDVEREERHQNVVVSHLAKMNSMGRRKQMGDSDLSYQDFTNDFGIHPYYKILDRHDRSEYHNQMAFESAKVSAFLMLPLNKASFEAQSGYKQSTFVMEQTVSVPNIETSTVIAPPFETAMKALRLNAGHMYGTSEPRPSVCKCRQEYGNDEEADNSIESSHSSNLKDGNDDRNESKAGPDEQYRDSMNAQNTTGGSASADQTDDEPETSSDDGGEDGEGGSGAGLFCFDCSSTDCDGMVQKIKDPALMILGSGKLKAYGQVELYH